MNKIMRFLKSKSLGLILVISCVLPGSAFANPIVITPTTDAGTLVNTILGTGVTLSGTPTLIGADTQQGTFTGGTGVLPFDSGIVLTSGDATSIPGPNGNGLTDSSGTVDDLTGTTFTGGNTDLNAIAGQNTFDQNVLSFDFIPDGDVISFQFAFGSEEYHDWVDSGYNDVFGFFLNGVNIGLVPGTSDPITVNSINCFDNSGYYYANSNSSPCFGGEESLLNIEYDGLAGGLFSSPLFATGAVNKGVVNSITLAIADAGDNLLDAGVFIKAGSFINTPPPSSVPEPSMLLLLGTGLMMAGIRRKKRS